MVQRIYVYTYLYMSVNLQIYSSNTDLHSELQVYHPPAWHLRLYICGHVKLSMSKREPWFFLSNQFLLQCSPSWLFIISIVAHAETCHWHLLHILPHRQSITKSCLFLLVNISQIYHFIFISTATFPIQVIINLLPFIWWPQTHSYPTLICYIHSRVIV